MIASFNVIHGVKYLWNICMLDKRVLTIELIRHGLVTSSTVQYSVSVSLNVFCVKSGIFVNLAELSGYCSQHTMLISCFLCSEIN